MKALKLVLTAIFYLAASVSGELAAQVVGSSDLSVTSEVSNDIPQLYDNIFYTLTVRNNGPDNNTNVNVQDTLPGNGVVLFGSAVASNGGTCSQDAGVVSCFLGDMSTGSSVTIEIEVAVVFYGSFENTATIAGALPDPNPDNNTSVIFIEASASTCALHKGSGFASPLGLAGFIFFSLGLLGLWRTRLIAPRGAPLHAARVVKDFDAHLKFPQ